jgi:hypothetical protein
MTLIPTPLHVGGTDFIEAFKAANNVLLDSGQVR